MICSQIHNLFERLGVDRHVLRGSWHAEMISVQTTNPKTTKQTLTMNPKYTIAAILAASIAAAGAANYSDSTVGTINGNGKTLFDATGDTVSSLTFATDMSSAF